MSNGVRDSSSPVDELVSAWQAAHARCTTVEGYWPRVQLVMWPASVVAVIVLLTNSNSYSLAAGIASVPTAIGFGAAGVWSTKLVRAITAEGRAWSALRERTGLSDAELGRMLSKG